MYELNGPYQYSVVFQKGSRRIPFELELNRIPDAELLKLDRLSQRTYQTQDDGGVVADFAGQHPEQALVLKLFDEALRSMNGKPITPELLAKIPQQVKRAAVVNCYCAVQPEVQDTEPLDLEKVADAVEALDALLAVETLVTITHVVNGAEEKLTHVFTEPTEKDALEYRQATERVKLFPGRRRARYATVERFDVYPTLYDRLAREVRGYTVGNQPVVSTLVQGWTGLIPYLHKKVAVQSLFGRAYGAELGEAE